MRLVVLLIGCSAITDFSEFSSGDMAYAPAGFAAPCDRNQAMPCVAGVARALQCFDELDGKVVMGNLCTRDCLVTVGCGEYPSATCTQVGTPLQANYCLPDCNLPSTPCRAGLTCCNDSGRVTSGAGVCKPAC